MKKQQKSTKIIVACADSPLRCALAYLLRPMGCGVECVASHRTLVARTMRSRYAVIITCFGAPLLANYPLARRLVGGSEHPTTLFVLTTSPSPLECVALLERGVDQVMSLPVSALRLSRKVRDSLSKIEQ